MNALPPNVAEAPGFSPAVPAGLRVVPAGVRVLLWCAVCAAVLMAIGIGVAMIAGNTSKDAKLGRTFLLTFACVLAIQGGYVLAPFSAGKGWWVWSFWLMVPIALLVLCTAMVPVMGAIRWTRPDGASGWKTITEMGWMSLIGVVLYTLPPILLWMYRPVAHPTATPAPQPGVADPMRS